MSSIEERVKDLEALIEKQSKIIATTGQKLIEIQINDVKSRMSSMDSNPKSTSQIDTEDYVTNEDVVQLVTELQSQLDFLEDRTIRRTYNTSVINDEEKIAPLSNKDGDFPTFPIPQTLGEFKSLAKRDTLRLGLFYEIILPNEEEIKHTLEHGSNSKNGIIDLATNKDISQLESQFDKEQVSEIYDELARYFGIKHRRRSDGW
ncbi:MRP8 [Candida oxycetoniae]|uniref:MRP8 n=1 Tax=Candida oxycetoniae TaxID=497107 RepID=A0AAI9T1J1_9ASCO|nr:MRP8 [Candida oxycetoniae]KAI3406659.2 MRP8 [Candida oxycetoniae]